MSLQDEGFRFVWQNQEFNWVHPAEITEGVVDCTDMNDAEFEAFVKEQYGAKNGKDA